MPIPIPAAPAPEARGEGARELLARGDYAAAAAVLGPMARSRPGDAETQALLALALLGRQLDARALAAADRAVVLRPGAEWAHRLRALALRRLGRIGAALQAAGEAARLAPEEAAVQCTLGTVLLGAGRAREADETLRRAAALEPRDPEARRLLGDAALLRDPVEAEGHYLASLENAPEHPPTLARLGLALERQRRFREAERLYDRAERLDPGLGTPRRRRAELVQRLQLGLGLFLAILGLGTLPPVARRFWPAARWPLWAVWALTLVLPLALFSWSAVRLWRVRREDGAPDPQLASILRAIEAARGARPASR